MEEAKRAKRDTTVNRQVEGTRVLSRVWLPLDMCFPWVAGLQTVQNSTRSVSNKTCLLLNKPSVLFFLCITLRSGFLHQIGIGFFSDLDSSQAASGSHVANTVFAIVAPSYTIGKLRVEKLSFSSSIFFHVYKWVQQMKNHLNVWELIPTTIHCTETMKKTQREKPSQRER